jgi:hypothetical protein
LLLGNEEMHTALDLEFELLLLLGGENEGRRRRGHVESGEGNEN